MKKKSSQSAFFNPRVLIGLFVVLAGVFLALLGFGAFSNLFAQTKSTNAAANMSPLSPLSRQAARAQAVRASQLPTTTSGAAGIHAIRILPMPQSPQVVLYDQYNNASLTASNSQDFEAAFDPFDDFLADDFVVPGGQTWNVESIDADGIPFNCSGSCVPNSFNVFFYTNSGGLPGTQVYSATAQSFVIGGSTYSITLTVPAVLTAGTYWVSVQARMDFTGNGEWGWTDRTVQSNSPAAWQNPGGGFGTCPSWTSKLICIPTAGGPDQVYRLNGTMEGLHRHRHRRQLQPRPRRRDNVNSRCLSFMPIPRACLVNCNQKSRPNLTSSPLTSSTPPSARPLWVSFSNTKSLFLSVILHSWTEIRLVTTWQTMWTEEG